MNPEIYVPAPFMNMSELQAGINTVHMVPGINNMQMLPMPIAPAFGHVPTHYNPFYYQPYYAPTPPTAAVQTYGPNSHNNGFGHPRSFGTNGIVLDASINNWNSSLNRYNSIEQARTVETNLYSNQAAGFSNYEQPIGNVNLGSNLFSPRVQTASSRTNDLASSRYDWNKSPSASARLPQTLEMPHSRQMAQNFDVSRPDLRSSPLASTGLAESLAIPDSRQIRPNFDFRRSDLYRSSLASGPTQQLEISDSRQTSPNSDFYRSLQSPYLIQTPPAIDFPQQVSDYDSGETLQSIDLSRYFPTTADWAQSFPLTFNLATSYPNMFGNRYESIEQNTWMTDLDGTSSQTPYNSSNEHQREKSKEEEDEEEYKQIQSIAFDLQRSENSLELNEYPFGMNREWFPMVGNPEVGAHRRVNGNSFLFYHPTTGIRRDTLSLQEDFALNGRDMGPVKVEKLDITHFTPMTYSAAVKRFTIKK